ncbi:porin [Acidovorax sp. SRB_14]|uniref:porin n=1 Tax=unclassified Acidovorax TaxID=2684926 RepID=UPI00145CEED3|nr:MULTISPECIES: porin [unclassified Acidovorax]NMM77690.1 porin [Acidovorax sp. SRB_24]NMM80285.1 porin [Acidovorax sp. SRB_14]NMM86816.1 porin [Rhodococcus sp. SRB_17]
MQNPSRLLLALLAVVGSSAALAQSSVTLYGRVNTTVEHQKTGDTKVNGLFNNSSRFGFKGTEDLGGGLKAGFQLESGFASDTGAGTGWPGLPSSNGGITFGRQSEVNLSGGFGMVRLGNFTPESYYATADYVSMHNHDTGSSSDALYYDPVWFGGLGTKNKVGYRTPSFGGLTVDAAVNLHEQTSGGKNGYDLAANYNMGPLALGAGYSAVNSNNQFGLRALYTIGQFTVGGYYQRNKDANQLVSTGAGTRNNFRLAGMYALGASEFHLNVGRANKWSNVADSGATQYTLAYNYNLSKRTKVYGYYTRVNNSANANYSAPSGQDFSSLAVGVRHNF